MTDQHPQESVTLLEHGDWPIGERSPEATLVYEELSTQQQEDTRRMMRASADWQLEQVVQWLRGNLERYMFYDGDVYQLPDDLEKAMRPNTTQENN